MVSERQASRLTVAVAATAIAVALLISIQLRLKDPLSSQTLTAEDPFTHMAYVREHLRDGAFDPLNPGGELYPPGMHALLAAVFVFTGFELYEILRVGAVALGAISVLGVALLLWRGESPIAAIVGAFAMAVGPEIIFRTTMMAPTALDLALVPFLLYAVLQLMQGRLEWAAAAAPLSFFLVYAHPWLFTILVLAGVAFAVLAIAMPWPTRRGAPLSAEGLAASIAIIGVCWGMSFNGCWQGCGPGFRDILLPGNPLAALAPLVMAFALVPAALALFAPRALAWIEPRDPDRLRPLLIRLALSSIFLLALVLITRPAFERGMPPHVDLVHMFGQPILLLGALGFLLVPFSAGPVAHMGAAIAATTYPFVIYNPLDSPFWSHRTAVYLGIGLVLLCGVAAHAIATGATRLVALAREWAERRQGRPFLAARPVFATLVTLLVAASLTQTVYAATPPPQQTWYRLYDDCQFGALRNLSRVGDQRPDALLVTGDWQAKLVLAALTPNASRVWFKSDFYTDPDGAGRLSFELKRPVYAVVDPHLKNVTPAADTEFLQHAPWHEFQRACPSPASGEPTIVVYTV